MDTGIALVVVDMQGYFCRPDSNFSRGFAVVLPDGAAWYAEQVQTTVIPTIASLLDRARSAGDVVAFTEFGSRRADGSDLPLWARRHNELLGPVAGGPLYLPLDHPDSRVIEEFERRDSELVVQKASSGPLAGTNLDQQLHDLGVTRVITTGVATNVCVLGMARELADCDFDVCVVSDGCATLGEEAHKETLAFGFPAFAAVVRSAQLDGWLALKP